MWPLGGEQRGLLDELAILIARGGAWRFLRGPVVAADPSSYPDEWDESLAGVARIVGRTLWHAHLSIATTVEDVRAPRQRSKLLRSTGLELARIDGAAAVLELSSLGNDDVAGIVAHEVGRMCVGWLARDGGPFRTTESSELPTRRLGSIATIYLGLGVVATNAAHHDRSAGEVRGQQGYHEHMIAHAGGLPVDALAFLLAVQATVRDDVLPALDTLRPTQAEQVAAWRELLDDREAELKQWLGIADATALEPLTRPSDPTPVMVVHGEIDERDLDKPFVGQSVYRYAHSRKFARGAFGVFGGTLFGLMGGALCHVSGSGLVVTTFAGVIVFMAWGIVTAPVVHRCATCDTIVGATDASCGGCGGTIIGEIARREDRLEMEENGHVSRKRLTRAEKLAAREAAQAVYRQGSEAEAALLARRRVER